jgi:DnaJ-class molecular chaperone
MSDQDTPEEGAEPAAPAECGPCRGLGKVVSNLGGTPSEVKCPWCEGTGRFIPDHDSQEHWEKGDVKPAIPAAEQEPSG